MHNKIPPETKEQILNFIKEYPAYGPRIEAELKDSGIFVGHTGIYNVLKKRGLKYSQKPVRMGKEIIW